jgi:hypothetical protein
MKVKCCENEMLIMTSCREENKTIRLAILTLDKVVKAISQRKRKECDSTEIKKAYLLATTSNPVPLL